MATGTEAYNNSLGGAFAGQQGRGLTVLWRVMDAAAIIAADGGTGLASATKITAGEEVTAFDLPIGFQVWGTVAYIKTAGTAGGTMNIGTVADTTAYDAAISTATAGSWFASATDAGAIASGGTLVTSVATNANAVVCEYIADETTGKVVVAVFGIDLSFLTEVA